MLPPPVFNSSQGLELKGISAERHRQLLSRLDQELGFSAPHISESASFCMAMVVRAALGLTAQEGKVLVIVGDSLAGSIAAATLRHLVNAGADGMVIVEGEPTKVGQELSRQLNYLASCGVSAVSLEEVLGAGIENFLDLCHNVIWGLFGCNSERIATVVEVLNEHSIPIHALLGPAGVDVDSGAPAGNPLYASSTLSLGLPFAGLHKGHDYVGRHYVADISIPRHFLGDDEAPAIGLFAQQPVIQIFPKQ